MRLFNARRIAFLFLIINVLLASSTSIAQLRPIIRNMLIGRVEGTDLKNFYKSQFKKSITDQQTLQESFVIDFCFIEKFTQMLEDAKNNYTGFRFVFGTDESDANKQKLFVVPTKKIGAEYYVNQWDLPPNSDVCSFKNFSIIGAAAAQKQEEKFSTFHRADATANPRNNLTKSVKFNIDVMQFIRDTIMNDPKKRLVDIRIFNVCYRKYIGNNQASALAKYGQINPIQSTIVIVFRRKNPTTSQIEDYWLFNESLLSEKKKDINFFDALNHGSLCPQICN